LAQAASRRELPLLRPQHLQTRPRPAVAMAGTRLLSSVALSLLVGGALATSPQRKCQEGDKEGNCTAGSTSSPSLLQKRTVVQHSVVTDEEEPVTVYHGSGCVDRVGSGSAHPAACIVVQDNRALLVNVYYGKSPGWDLPGGWHHGGEAPCETAEREVCEETGMSVKAVAKLSFNVFRCEVTGTHVCTKPVDEGFLQYKFFAKEDLAGLKFRGGSWGDKVGLLHKSLHSSSPDGSPDACGCRKGIDGWSTTTQQCRTTSQTSPLEAIMCQRKSNSGDFDVCGCRRGVEGWSTTSKRCSSSSQTSPSEAATCGQMKVESAEED